MGKIKKARICPKCGSLNIKPDLSNIMILLGGVNPNYKCKNCNYSGILFPEVVSDEVKNFRKTIENANRNAKQESSGKPNR